MEVQQAQDALHAIERAKCVAERNSQNNGAVPSVWGVAVFVSLAGFDVFPALAAQWYGPENAGVYGPLMAAAFLLPVVLCAAWWTRRYVRRLPVTSRGPGNPWLFVRDARKAPMLLGAGWWAFYHIGILFDGLGIGLWLAQRAHRHSPPFLTFTLTGLIDAAPLVLTGWTQWRRLRRQEAGA